MLWLQTQNPTTTGTMNLGGSLTRQVEQDCAVNEQNPHLVNIGKMIEVWSLMIKCFFLTYSHFKDQENKMRATLNEVYFGKARQIVGDLRTVDTTTDLKNRIELG
jgi:capping protein (actin filament) muscle Z-line, beta